MTDSDIIGRKKEKKMYKILPLGQKITTTTIFLFHPISSTILLKSNLKK